MLATASAVSRLMTYAGVCASTLVLRRPAFAGNVRPATFVAPLGPVVPILAILVSLIILAGASPAQLIGGAVALAAGAALFLMNNRLAPIRSLNRLGTP